MRTMFKYAAGLTLAGALAFAAAGPSQARWHGHGAGAAVGFAAGALVGAAAASATGSYYGPGYYAYAPGYDQSYAYDPGIAADYGYKPYGPRSGYYDRGYRGYGTSEEKCNIPPSSYASGTCAQ